jgi:hypothetical protein
MVLDQQNMNRISQLCPVGFHDGASLDGGRGGKFDKENGAFPAPIAMRADTASVEINNRLADRQPDSQSAELPMDTLVPLLKYAENPRQVLRGNAHPPSLTSISIVETLGFDV